MLHHRDRDPFRRARSIQTSALAAAALLLGGCGRLSVLSPAGPVSSAERTILFNSLTIMLAIVVPTLLAIAAFAFWFRARNTRARYLPDWDYSGRLELIVWSIPALTVLFLGGIAWLSSHQLDPARPLETKRAPLDIEVVALDWKWLFIYPQQGIASVNRVVAPAGVPLHFSITSASVLNVFFVPRLGSEIYGMYGMTSQLYLQADKPGVYPGIAAHFNGDGFSDMHFELEAVAPPEFAAWQSAARGSDRMLDESSYRALLHQSENVRPYSYGRVQPGLFQDIVMQHIPPGEGPGFGPPGVTSSGEPR
jgi:cytochrome o ubiquinol oxidase subunit 2